MTLVAFSNVDRSALRWLRTQDAPAGFSLLSGEQEVGSVAFVRSAGSLAVARSAERAWTLKRAGFLAPGVVVRQENGLETVAHLSAHLRRHDISMQGGLSYSLRRSGHLPPAWKVSGDRGEEVLHIEPVAEGRHLRAGAVLVSSRRDAPELLLLNLIAWYFVVLTWFEDEALETLTPFEGPDPPVRADGAR